MKKLDKEKFLEETRAIEEEEDDVEYLLKTLEIIFKYAYSEETAKKIIKNLRDMMFKRKLERIIESMEENSKKACQTKKNMVK